MTRKKPQIAPNGNPFLPIKLTTNLRIAPMDYGPIFWYPMPMAQNTEKMIELLNQEHQWPTIFAFKFIVPLQSSQALEKLFPEAHKMETRNSSGGKYVAYTVHHPVASAQEVLDLYARAQQIEGLLAL